MKRLFAVLLLCVAFSCSDIPVSVQSENDISVPSSTHTFTGDWIQAQIDGWIQEAADRRGEDPETMNRVYVMPGKICLQEGTYILTKPIDARGMRGLVIEGAGYGTRVMPRFTYADARKPMFDFTGSSRSVMRNIKIFGGNQRPIAGCAILHARAPTHGSAGDHKLENIWVEGMFNVAGYVNVASETNVVDQCKFTMLNDHSPAVIICAENMGIKLDAEVGASTMLVGEFRNCYFSRYPQPINGVAPDYKKFKQPVLWLKAGHSDGVSGSFGDLTFQGGGIEGRGAMSVLLSCESGMINHIRFRDLRCESDRVDDWLVCNVAFPRGIGYLNIQDCQIMIKNRVVAASRALMGNMVFRNNRVVFRDRNPNHHMIECMYAIDCTLESPINYQSKGIEKFFRAGGYAKYSRFRIGSMNDVLIPSSGGNIFQSFD